MTAPPAANLHAVHRPVPLSPMPQRPLVSVLITNYNYGEFIARAIQSVLHQTYDHFELVVVDDGSTDNSIEIIEPFTRQDPRVKLLRKANGGMASSWNAGFADCTGEIFCPLDADDAFAPGKLSAVVDYLRRRPRAGLLIHAMTVIDAHDHPIQQLPFLTAFEEGWIADKVLRRGGRWRYMPTSAVCFRREMAGYFLPVPEKAFFGHAESLAVTLGPLLTEVAAIGEPLSCYRIHGASIIGGGTRDLVSARKVIKFTTETTQGVNHRLAELGVPVRLNERKNLEFQQAVFVQSLFDGTRMTSLMRMCARFVAATFADDLYSVPQKLLGLVVYSTAVLLPAHWRSKWIDSTLGFNRVKYAVQRAMGFVKGKRRTASSGTPGEASGIGGRPRAGRGEGDSASEISNLKFENHPHPNPLPEYRERGQSRPPDVVAMTVSAVGR